MPSMLSGFREGFADLAKQRRERPQQELDQAIKYAQLAESGYQVGNQGGRLTLSRDPNVVSTKELERQKLQTENALNTLKLNRIQNAFGGSGQRAFGGGNLTPKTYDEYGIPASYYDPQAELEQKAREESQKPLSSESAGRLEGAKQSLEQAQSIRGMVKPENFRNLVSGYGKIRMGRNFGITDPASIKGNIINAVGLGLPRQMVKTSDEQKKFELAVNLIAENNLRARTGAAAPTQEQIREEARQLVGDDTYESFLNRLGISEQYAQGIAENIRPGSAKKFGQAQGAQVPNWASADPERYLFAKSKGHSDQEIAEYFKATING